jgi:hypothetical protein
MVDVRHRAPLPPPRPPALLERRVVELTLKFAQPVEGAGLADGRAELVAGRAAPAHRRQRTKWL